jgi:hypothetical protein
MTLRFLLKAGGVLLGAVAVIITVTIATAVYTGKLAGPISWRFPEGYRGWVLVEFQNSSCPPLAKEGLHLVVPISASGRGCTSSPIPEGWRYVRYESLNSRGERTKLRADGWNTDSLAWPIAVNREKREWYLFVGTQEELRRSGGSQPH